MVMEQGKSVRVEFENRHGSLDRVNKESIFAIHNRSKCLFYDIGIGFYHKGKEKSRESGMSEQSTFNQKKVAENAYTEPSGVLDQLNFPPGAIRFIRNNKRVLQIIGVLVVVVVMVVVVAGSFYQSYRTNRLKNAASSLSISMDAEGENKIKALEQVAADFSGTPSALWATVELGHLAMKDKLYTKAGQYYSQVREEISAANPMYGLLTYGIAQAEEAGKNYLVASASYSTLKEIEGYKDEGFMGMGRVLEAEGKNQEALAVYEEYLGSFLGEEQNQRMTTMIQEKITRLRVQK
jgi:predicted negative regulator of RcsB-dependent stress response